MEDEFTDSSPNVFHRANHYHSQDAMFEQMTFDNWQASISPKIHGTWNLHDAFSDLRSLDFFVTLSSVASVIGNMGQANYSAGNGYMDALMRWRRQHGLPGHSINIGLVPDASGVGEALASESPEQRRQRYRHLERTEILQHEIQARFRAIVQGICPVPAQVIAGMTDILPRGLDGTGASPWQFDRKFDHRARLVSPDASDGLNGAAGAATKPSVLLKKAESVDDALRVVQQALQEYLGRAMAASPEDIDLEMPFSALGGMFCFPLSPMYSYANGPCVSVSQWTRSKPPRYKTGWIAKWGPRSRRLSSWDPSL